MQNAQGKTALGLDANVGALLCYVGNFVCSLGLIYSIVVVITDKQTRLTRFHAFQSILCSVCGAVIGAAAGIIGAVGGIVDTQIGFPLLTMVIGLIALVFGVGLLIMFLLAAFKAYKGEFYKIPVLGNFAEKWA